MEELDVAARAGTSAARHYSSDSTVPDAALRRTPIPTKLLLSTSILGPSSPFRQRSLSDPPSPSGSAPPPAGPSLAVRASPARPRLAHLQQHSSSPSVLQARPRSPPARSSSSGSIVVRPRPQLATRTSRSLSLHGFGRASLFFPLPSPSLDHPTAAATVISAPTRPARPPALSSFLLLSPSSISILDAADSMASAPLWRPSPDCPSPPLDPPSGSGRPLLVRTASGLENAMDKVMDRAGGAGGTISMRDIEEVLRLDQEQPGSCCSTSLDEGSSPRVG